MIHFIIYGIYILAATVLILLGHREIAKREDKILHEAFAFVLLPFYLIIMIFSFVVLLIPTSPPILYSAQELIFKFYVFLFALYPFYYILKNINLHTKRNRL